MITAGPPARVRAVRDEPLPYGTHGVDAVEGATRRADALDDAGLPESTLTALWLLGRVPEAALPYPVVRWGRAGRGPGPDVREATLLLPSGVTRTGDVEVHLRASDFVHHGHLEDPAYAGVILHLCWEDDRPHAGGAGHGGGPPPPTALPGGGEAPTVVLAPLLGDPARVAALVARGPSGSEPCAGVASRAGVEEAGALVREQGRRRLAERAWRAWRLADRYGFVGAFRLLLDRALASTAGRVRETEAAREALAAAVMDRLGADPVAGLERLALDASSPAGMIDAFRVPGVARIGRARAAEVAWNAALPLLAALAAAYDDAALARTTSALAAAWPAPRPYGRTRALAALAAPPPRRPGALYAQGLLHLQDLWCTRGGCGACPLSAPPSEG